MNKALLAYKNPELPIDERVNDLLKRMTLEEKVVQLYAINWESTLLDENGNFSLEDARRSHPHGAAYIGRVGMHNRGPAESAQLTNAVQRYLVEETRLGIPALVIDEALHGHMAFGSTSFPQAIALGSTWDPALVERVFSAAAAEMRARGGNYALTPVLDLARDPRWGRTEETYGEDPFLTARLGCAAVRGLQGARLPIEPDRVLATAKHFAVHGQPEAGTNSGPANYAERIVREQFLEPFRAAVMEAGVYTVMASYNEINGVPSHVNTWLLEQVLRREWGFQGLVCSDGNGVDELVFLHRVAVDQAEAARKSLAAGVDIELGGCFATLLEQVKDGKVLQALLDRAVGRMLRAKFMLGLFENPYCDPQAAADVTNCAAHQALALEAARKAAVLLKNQGGLLPLDERALKRIAVIGPNAAQLHLGGYSVDPGRGVSILDGIRARVPAVEVTYAEGCRITDDARGWQDWWRDEIIPPNPQEEEARITEAVEAARGCDLAVLVVGENESICREGWSREHLGDRDTLDLAGRQDELIHAVVETGVPVVLVLVNGRPLSINYAAAHVPAILECWYLGQESGTAVAEILFGDVNPGGKLPITFPRTVGQIPAYYYHKPSGRRGYVFSDASPLFHFGHGLSYTTFAYSHLQVSPQCIRPAESATLSVRVTNTGARAGDEVVQFYLRDQVSSLTRPVKELRGFERISLQPGESRTVHFTVSPAALQFLGPDMQPVVEPGLFDLMVGGSSAEVQSVTLEVVGDEA